MTVRTDTFRERGVSVFYVTNNKVIKHGQTLDKDRRVCQNIWVGINYKMRKIINDSST